MATPIRRVLLMMLLLAAALPWLTQPHGSLAQPAGAGEARADQPDNAQADNADDPTADTDAEADAGAGASAAASRPVGMNLPTGSTIGVVTIEGALLHGYQLDSLKRRVDRALNGAADLIVFELDTPGGDLMLAVEMSSYIRTLPVPTVAWVHDRALSAGILIGSACDELVMSRGSLTGDCGPIVPGRTMGSSERAKALSILLAEFRANAQDNYAGPTTNDYALFNAMAVLGIDVYEVRHERTGEVRLVSQADYAVMVDGVSPLDASKTEPSDAGSALVDPESGEDLGRPSVTVDQAEQGRWAFVRQVHNGSDFITLSEKEALDIGLSRKTVNSLNELKQLYGAGRVQRYEETWSESLVGFLVHPVVRGALFLLALAGLLIEYLSPGLIVPGLVGLAAMATVIGAPFLVGLAETWHLVIIVIGAGLLVFELLTMSTFGILAIVGLLMLLAGLILSGVESAANGLPAAGAGRQIIVTSASFVGALLLSIPMLFVLTRYFGSLPLLNRLVLANDADNAASAVGNNRPMFETDPSSAHDIKVGSTGKVSSTGLRPTGRIEVGDELIDVTSTGGFIDPGTTVRVVEVYGSMIRVEPAEEAEQT